MSTEREMENPELKPCPFCGYALTNNEGICPVSECVDDDTGEWEFTGICCPSCAVFLPAGESASAQEGINLWNDRPAIATKDAELDSLREALIHADMKIRSFPGADQSDVEFIRTALGRR